MIRIGHGFDAHRFDEHSEGPLTIGGTKIEGAPAMLAHSDGDVMLHAVIDAILGALALGDIGSHFPDTDEQYKGADSRELLKHVMALVWDKEYEVNNLDVTIIAQTPRMAEHIPNMKKHLAIDSRTEIDRINVKATTTEKMGYIGRKEGIAVHAVVSLIKQSA